MNMKRKMLYEFMTNSYISPTFYEFNKIYDFYFNEKIGFNECFKIQEDIKKNIINEITFFNIDYCAFIQKININLESTKNKEHIYSEYELFNWQSNLLNYNDNVLDLQLITRDWISDSKNFNYNIIRYSLYIVYYLYLRKNNPNHYFVKFVEYLSKIDFYDPGLEEYIPIKKYIDSLKETKQKTINEKLFDEAIYYHSKLITNKMKFCPFIE